MTIDPEETREQEHEHEQEHEQERERARLSRTAAAALISTALRGDPRELVLIAVRDDEGT